jgi:hypothetical protein
MPRQDAEVKYYLESDSGLSDQDKLAIPFTVQRLQAIEQALREQVVTERSQGDEETAWALERDADLIAENLERHGWL